MNPLIFTNVFASVHIGVKECFCGKLAMEDHDFCFCSPNCARADSLRTLGGQEHVLLRHKSEHQLRSVSTSRHVSVSQHLPRPHEAMKALPTVDEITSSLVARQGRYEDKDSSVYSPRRPFERRNDYVDVQQSPLPERTLKRSLPSKSGLNKGVRSSIFAMFRKKQTSQPDAKIRRKSLVTGVILQEMEEEPEEEAAWQSLLNYAEDGSRPLTLVHRQVRQTTTIRRSRVIRRSTSFAGLNSQIGNRSGEK